MTFNLKVKVEILKHSTKQSTLFSRLIFDERGDNFEIVNFQFMDGNVFYC